ncbi:MAG: glycosyltransferase family 2 protein [Thermodesulfobacteriota bacterium]|nr:glycosyltransferase family 2 protein [Thermodesulfobacteriota bacterium]
MSETKISVVIPAYNEAQTIGNIVKKVKSLYPDFEIIVIDDHSADNTAEVASNAGASVHSHPYNIGNGASIKTGIRVASGDIFVFMDADGQHDPKNIEKLIEHFPEFDMVVGDRSKGKNASIGRSMANRVYNWLATYVANFPIQDLTSGFRAVKSDIARDLSYLLPNSYSYPTTLTLSVIKCGRALKYIPIDGKRRKKGESNIKILKDGIRFFLIIMKIATFYSPLRIFLPVSFLMFSLGILNYIYTYIYLHRFTNMSMLLLTTSVIIFLIGLVSEQISQMRFDRRN